MSSTVIVLEELLMQHIFGVIRTVFVTLVFVFLFKLFIFILLLAKSIFKQKRVLRTVCVCALFGNYFFSKSVKPHLSQLTVAKLQFWNRHQFHIFA
jgi:hypothetical protein